MAIQFARIELVGRATGGNACCKGAYNARAVVRDKQTNIIYNFSNRGDNVHHEILLPEGVDTKFKNTKVLMNEVERIEKRKNSSLLKDIVIALPDDKELDLQDRINISHIIIKKMGWTKEGLGVQLDIHQPHDGEKNWHAHILLTKRRFAECGTKLGTKARDLDIQIRGGSNPFGISEEQMIHEKVRDIINDYFKELGLENRVDAIGINSQEHIGPIRMRSVMNAAAMRNDERRLAEIERLSSGAAVLDKVTRHMSVFSKGDLERAVKCIDNFDTRETLVKEALKDNSIISLFTESGRKTSYFTTNEIRLEESRILRLSGYVASVNNIFGSSDKASFKSTQGLIELERGNLTTEQHKALSELITSTPGLNILRGRAGVGKSHVLRKLATIAKASSINVIGLAPTHKAKEALAADGFEHTDTIKGMLFKLANGRFSLPKQSLLIVDEAGMIGNDDYSELLRVAATRKCSVILSGDERQLASVQRGGMFEIFAGKYGSSTIFDIKRQATSWGKEVATAFSEGNVRSGIATLEKENRINKQTDREGSIESLLANWHYSNYEISDRLILAVRNKDVATLNHGAREYLKKDEKLTGIEIEVGGNHYMKGDRIMIGKTDKHLGITNGEIGELLEVSKGRFVVAMRDAGTRSSGGNNGNDGNSNSNGKDNGDNTGKPAGTDKDDSRIIEFNPAEYHSFRHGYATTVFKAQGASIKDVYVFHDGFAGLRNSYVALSRNINELNLYINSRSTHTSEHLIKQLSYDPELGSSLHYCTETESKTHQDNAELLKNIGAVDKFLLSVHDFASRNITKLTDKYLPKHEYYNYKEPDKQRESVTQVIDKVYEQNQNTAFAENIVAEKLVVGGGGGRSSGNARNNDKALSSHDVQAGTNINTNHNLDNSPQVNNSGFKQSAKARFYANADYNRNNNQKDVAEKDLKLKWDRQTEILRKEASFKTEQIARDLLGEPNKRLSNGKELRFGEGGKIAVRISGEKSGTWYDFSKGVGGDVFALVKEQRGCDFKGAAEYLRQSLSLVVEIGSNVSNNSSLRLVHDFENSNVTAKYIKEQQSQDRADKAKQVAAVKLYESSKAIEDNTTAHRYLIKVRGISCTLGQDIKAASIYDKEKALYLPALVAFARDGKGNITGGVQILLDSKTGNKASVEVPKKSFGKIAGSFVDVGSRGVQNNTKDKTAKHKITVIAEGLETALSIKQALLNDHNNVDKEFKVLCSLGVSNIKNYKPEIAERVIIAADNDGHNSITDKTIKNAKDVLAGKGAFVEIARPGIEGDFNDLLMNKSQGKAKEEGDKREKEIARAFSRALRHHTAVTLGQYFANKEDKKDLSEQEKAYIDYLNGFKIEQDKIVDAYRAEPVKGKLEIEIAYKLVVNAGSFVYEHKRIIDEANLYGAKINNHDLTITLAGKSYAEMEAHLFAVRDKYRIIDRLDELAQTKQEAKTPQTAFDALKAEQQFLSRLRNNINSCDHSSKLLKDIELAHAAINSKGGITRLYDAAHYAYKEKIISSDDLTGHFKSAHSLSDIHSNINSICYKHHCDILNDHHKKLTAGLPVIHQGHKFDCVVEYLEHWKENVHHDMLPIKKIDHIIDQELNRQREHDHHHSLDL